MSPVQHFVDLVINGDPARARATVGQELVSRGFRITWSDEWTGLAERGSVGANVVLGAAAQYFKVGLRVMSGAYPGQAIVRIEELSSGWMGGAIGAHRTATNFQRLRDDLWRTFYDAGVLVGVTER